jgi:hypothetical protein
MVGVPNFVSQVPGETMPVYRVELERGAGNG